MQGQLMVIDLIFNALKISAIVAVENAILI